MGIIYQAQVSCDSCGATLTMAQKSDSAPDKAMVISAANREGWRFRYTTGGIAFCPGCAAERITRRAAKA